jgi:hypothetical protein
MSPRKLFLPTRIAVFFLVLILLLLVGAPVWQSIRNAYVPTLYPNDNLDEYIHRQISISGRYCGPGGINDDFGSVQFGDERIIFCAGRDALQLLKDGDTVLITGELLGPEKASNSSTRPRTILRARAEKFR